MGRVEFHMMRMLLSLGIVLMVIGVVMGAMHLLGFLIGDTLSWVALVLFVVGLVMSVVGSMQPARREMRA
jgi:hypothetical protein